MGIFNTLPETEEIRHCVNQRRGLRPEQNGERTDCIPTAFIKFNFVLDRRTVLIFQGTFQRERITVRGKKRNEIARWLHQFLDG